MPTSLPTIRPMPLYQIREPFDGDDWMFEIKYDGFRALAFIENGCARLVSRNGYVYRSFPALCESIGDRLKCADAVLDGEIVCLGEDGRPVFNRLLYRRGHVMPCHPPLDERSRRA